MANESVAYQQYEEIFGSHPKEEQPALHAVPSQETTTSYKVKRKKQPLRFSTVAFTAVAIFTAICMLYCQMQLTELTASISSANENLDKLSAENVSLSSKRAHKMDLDEVEDYAVKNLGMVKMDTSQIEYIELTNPDNVTVFHPGMSFNKIVDNLTQGISQVWEYIQ